MSRSPRPAGGYRRGPGRRPWPVTLLLVAVLVELTAGVAGLRHVAAAGATRPAAGSAALRPTGVNARPTTPDYSGGLGQDRAGRAARTAAVRDLLERHASALLRRDRAAFLATVDPRATAFRASQSALFANLAQVPLESWDYKLDPSSAEPVSDPSFARYGDPVWAPRVTLRYALRGFDPVPTDRPQFLTFVRRGGRWYLGSDRDFDGRGDRTWRGLWDFGPVVAYRGSASLVLAHPRSANRLATFASVVDRAVPHVTDVWGPGWSQRVVVLIPDTQQEMSHLIGGQFALAHIAAVATADYTDASSRTVRGQRVVINPSNLDRLGSVGRLVVLRHEITHVATRAITGPAAPIWLVEGFADYVGYLDTGVPVTVAAQELRAEVRRGRVPAALPTAKDFGGDNPRLSQSYEEAWLACRLLAARTGQAGLVRFYRLVGSSTGDPRQAVTRALRVTAHLSYPQFVADWRHLLATDLS
ncbi:MAG TPA: hypothetical protein VFX70_18200 [Mycobacteriales bacterium]|nr:hypothetical protein [Mycobacteriales bacterium]